MARANRFEDLLVWQKSRDLAVEVYRVTRVGQFARDPGLRDQIRRAAVSVMSNVAEGFDRHSRSEFRHFLAIARGSAGEVRSQLHLAFALGYLPDAEYRALAGLCWETTRMLGSLRTRLQDQISARKPKPRT